MTDDLRWAVRYAFLEDLWRERARVIVDAGLEAALRGAGSADADDPVEELVDALVPRVPKARTWMAVSDEAVARELAQTRPGTGFLPRSSFADVVAYRDWAVALVELSALDEDAPGGARLREQLAERAREGRTVLVSVPAAPGDTDDEDAGFAALADLLDEALGGGRIYGVYRPPMAALVDFGGDEDDEDAEVPLAFDNTLGTQAPRFVEYVAVAGEAPALPEGMTLVELPDGVAAVELGADDTLRERLLQAQRQAELAAIDRQALLEQVDELESVRQKLEQQASDLRDELARAVTEQGLGEAEANERVHGLQADNQALRWKVQQLERELDAVKARPVEALEAEVASLRAQLEARDESAKTEVAEAGKESAKIEVAEAEGGNESVPSEVAEPEAAERDASESPAPDAGSSEMVSFAPEIEDEAESDDTLSGGPDAAEAPTLETLQLLDEDDRLDELEDEAIDAAERRRFGAALAQLDRLITQVERGGIGVLPLRQALVALRRRLRE